MERDKKRTYVIPTTQVVEMRSDSILCASVPTGVFGGGSQNWGGGSSPVITPPFVSGGDWGGGGSPGVTPPFTGGGDW